jgi:hypothetical protein
MKASGLAAVLLTAALLTVACTDSSSLLVERKEITQGSFHGITIGSDKQRVLASIFSMGAYAVRPVTCLDFSVGVGNRKELPALSELHGVRASAGDGQYANVYFDAGRVSKILATPSNPLFPDLKVGDSTEAVSEQLDALWSARPDVTVIPLPAYLEGGVFKLGELGEDDKLRLFGYNCWQFEVSAESPAGAVYKLHFSRDGLERISYQRARIRVD